MKKNNLINLILYNNEPELLEKRMSYYEGVVDEFIIIAESRDVMVRNKFIKTSPIMFSLLYFQ
jgi:hypothetical protein